MHDDYKNFSDTSLRNSASLDHASAQLLNAHAMTKIAKGFARPALIAPDLQQGAQRRRQVVQMNKRGIERVQTRIGLVSADIDVVEILCAPHNTDITHVGTRTAIGTASHADAHRFVFQSQ